jgi:Uri superfamily endonuclease
MNPAETVIHEEDARAVVALPKIRCAAKLRSHWHSEFLFPALRAQLLEISRAKLHCEISAAVAAAVAAVALLAYGQDQDR